MIILAQRTPHIAPASKVRTAKRMRALVHQYLCAFFVVCAAVFLCFSITPRLAHATFSTSKSYTLTKKAANATTEDVVNHYDSLYECIDAMDINDTTSLYTIYVNKDTIIPESESNTGRFNNKIRLTSVAGSHYTLTRKGAKDIISMNSNSELTIDNITLDGNSQSQCFSLLGGAKATLGKGVTIQNFADNSIDGPAIYANNGELTIKEGVTIQNNTSKDNGGAIYCGEQSTLTIEGGTFCNNLCTGFGGAISTFGTLSVANATFTNNKAGDKKGGGAVFVAKSGRATIDKSTFSNNEARMGGGIYSSCEVTVTSSTFTSNTAVWGGGMFSTNKLTISNSTFEDNTATSAGGALYLNKQNGEAQINASTFINNKAAVNGGAIYTWKSDNHNPIADNEAYRNITTDAKMIFQNNVAQGGSYTPPDNFATFTNLLFSSESDVAHVTRPRASLLNNNDINYVNPYRTVVFMQENDRYTMVKVEPQKSINGDGLSNEMMPEAPTKVGHTFKEWNTQLDGAGTTFTGDTVVNEDLTVYAVYTKAAGGADENEPTALYRLYNPYTHEHLFTTSMPEKDNLVAFGWNFEGVVGYVRLHGEKGGVYRLYNPSTGEHHYTMKEAEVASCVAVGWKNEGVKFFSVQDKDKQVVGVASMYNPYEARFYHHYTADTDEIVRMVEAGWRKEEIKWYVAGRHY